MVGNLTISVLSHRLDEGFSGGAQEVCAFWRERLRPVLTEKPDLIVLPEVCELSHGSPSLEDYLKQDVPWDAPLLTFFTNLAIEQHCWIALPTLRKDERGLYRNSVRLISRTGEVAGVYDKNYPTIGEVEAGITPGDRAQVIETEFGRVACVICFDLNFEQLRQHYASQQPDLILFCSMYHGGLAQQMWAYDCRAHLASAVSNLPAGIISPVGETLATTTHYTPHITSQVNLDCCVAHFDYNREKFTALKQQYGPQVSVHDPGLLGSVLITSHLPTKTAKQIAKEFGIELLDDYLKRAKDIVAQAKRETTSP